MLSAATLIVAVVSMTFPLGNIFGGDASISAALTTAMALVVASLGVVLAVYMQSAEYRRRTEIVGGIQNLKIILGLMLGRWGTMAGRQKLDQSNLKFDVEKAKFLEILIGPTGSFLNLYRSKISKEAGNSPEVWRLMPIHIASIAEANSINECVEDIAELHSLIEGINAKKIREIAKLAVSETSFGEWKVDILVEAAKGHLSTKRNEDSKKMEQSMEPAEFERLCDELIAEMGKTEQGKKALAELNDSINEARNGDQDSIKYIVSLHKAIFR